MPGNVDDMVPLKYENFIRVFYGKLVADKGYISQNCLINYSSIAFNWLQK